MNEKELTIEYLKYEGICFREETSKNVITRFSRGVLNPNNLWLLWIIQLDTAEPIYSFYHAIDYVERNGLRKI